MASRTMSRGRLLPVAMRAVAVACLVIACTPAGANMTLAPTLTVPSATVVPSLGPVVTALPTATPEPFPTPAGTFGPPLQVVLVSSSIWPGGTSLLFTLNETDNTLVDDPRARVAITATEVAPPDGQVAGRLATEAHFVRPPSTGRPLFVAEIDFARPGTWHLDVMAVIDGVWRAGASPTTVSWAGATPTRGTPAPTFHTRTSGDAGGNLGTVVGPPFADPRFYQTSVDEALAQHIPFVLVLDSARWRTSIYCGFTILMVEQVAPAWPAMTFMHVEPFKSNIVDGSLVLDPPGGPAEWSPAANAWGLTPDRIDVDTSPWVFVVDGSGHVFSKFQGLIGAEELEAALFAVAST